MAGRKGTTARKQVATGKAKKPAGSKETAAAPTRADARKPSQIAVAIQVLAKAKEPMSCRELVEAMTKRNLWQSPDSKSLEDVRNVCAAYK